MNIPVHVYTSDRCGVFATSSQKRMSDTVSVENRSSITVTVCWDTFSSPTKSLGILWSVHRKLLRLGLFLSKMSPGIINPIIQQGIVIRPQFYPAHVLL